MALSYKCVGDLIDSRVSKVIQSTSLSATCVSRDHKLRPTIGGPVTKKQVPRTDYGWHNWSPLPIWSPRKNVDLRITIWLCMAYLLMQLQAALIVIVVIGPIATSS